MVKCASCEKPTERHFAKEGKWLCARCFNDDAMRMVATKRGMVPIRVSDRFLLGIHKWYIVDFADDDIVVRLEGTADVTTLPELLVAELVDEYNGWVSYYLR